MTGFQNMIILGRGRSKPIQASSMWYHQSWQNKTKKYPDDEQAEKLMIQKLTNVSLVPPELLLGENNAAKPTKASVCKKKMLYIQNFKNAAIAFNESHACIIGSRAFMPWIAGNVHDRSKT
jgi:hypothetical protein